MKAKYPKVSEDRKEFERWYRRNHFCSAADLRRERTEHGYTSHYIDGVWTGWLSRGEFEASR